MSIRKDILTRVRGTHVFKFGFRSALGTVEETVWDVGGMYNYIPSASALNISSTNSADGITNDGARTVQIYGLDSAFSEINETITLSGNTAISTVNTYARVYRGVVRTAGSSGGNIGIIYAGTGTTSSNGIPETAHMGISSGENQTLMAVFTVPANKTGYLSDVSISVSGLAADSATIQFKARPENEVFQTKNKFVIQRAGSPVLLTHGTPMPFAEKTDLEVRGQMSANTADVSASFSITLIPK